MRPTIALLTDFGLRDHYVAAMKGVILTIAPDATLIDITHDIAPQDVLGGALELEASCGYFPPGTVFVAVVDPGVGSSRRALAAASRGRYFVGPDNGLLWPAVGPDATAEWRALTEERFWRPTVSRTFEGRDRFAPAAAWLAAGTALGELGVLVDPVRLLEPQPDVVSGSIAGQVIRVDRFGNLITNVSRTQLGRLASPYVIELNGQSIPGTVGTFADVPTGAPCAFVGSSERLEVAVNGGDASERFGVRRGAPVRVRSGA